MHGLCPDKSRCLHVSQEEFNGFGPAENLSAVAAQILVRECVVVIYLYSWPLGKSASFSA
jgi:hypothetical protein